MSENLSKNVNVMSDETALGVFDTDGSVQIVMHDYARAGTPVKEGNQPFGVDVSYYLGQSKSKIDLVDKFAEKFEGSANVGDEKVVFEAQYKTKIGLKVRLFLSNKKPLHPDRLRDYLVSEVIIELKEKGAQKTKEGLATLAYLVHNKSSNLNGVWRLRTPQSWVDLIKASPEELKAGEAKAFEALVLIEKEVVALEKQLPRMKLSLDYIRGAHFGDGGFTVTLPEPSATRGRRITPEWTISGENLFYCQAFVNTLGGDTNKSGTNCTKFRLSGIIKCKGMLYIFDEALWMPEYKKKQFENWKQAVLLLAKKEHFTKEGTIKLVDLIYDNAEKGARRHPKAQIIEWYIAWLKENNYI